MLEKLLAAKRMKSRYRSGSIRVAGRLLLMR